MKKNHIIISIISLVILFIVLLGFYPGIVSFDGVNQWQQVQSGIITNAHPFFSTYFMFLLSKIWNSVTMIAIYQIILVSISWGYLCKCINLDNKKQFVIMCIFTVLVMICPLTSIYSITIWKDIIYTSYLLICAIMLFDWSNNNYEFSIFKYCLLGFIISMIYSYRHNGIIVAILVLICFCFIFIKKYKNNLINKNNFKKCFCVIGVFIISLSIISIPKKIILNESSKKIKDEVSYSTVDSYMLWMMGAHIRENNINNSDKEFLNKIIPLDEWNSAYNPYLINNTGLSPNLDKKYLVNNSSKFRKVFIKYSIKNPVTIFNHYVKADSLLINPVASLNGYVYVYCFSDMWPLPKYTRIKPIFKPVYWFYMKMIDISLMKPFIMFYQPAFILYLSLLISFILAKRVYGKRIWLFSLPMILNIVSLLPINLAQDLRYVYINYWTFYGLLLLLVINYKKIFNRQKA